MNKRLDKYLKELQNSESIFPMDSVHTGKKLVLYKKEKENKDEDVNNKRTRE